MPYDSVYSAPAKNLCVLPGANFIKRRAWVMVGLCWMRRSGVVVYFWRLIAPYGIDRYL